MSNIVEEFLNALPETAQPLLSKTGKDIVEEIGLDVLREVILDVLTGKNIRDRTETFTRQRLALLNAALITQYVKVPGSETSIYEFIDSVADALENEKFGKEDGWMLNWALGLTGKSVQNVLRDKEYGVKGYTDRFAATLKKAAIKVEDEMGSISGSITIDGQSVPLDWLFVLFLAVGIGSQTLTIRGSEKSAYGKFFEKLILVSVLHVLGFKFAPTGIKDPSPGQFWLSTSTRRESDATLLISEGKGVYFDIGFIGRGNPEIILDKVSRFDLITKFNQRDYGMATYIIIDRIGKRSALEERAAEIDGTVIQMSMSYWPKTLASKLQERYGFENEVLNLEGNDLKEHMRERLESAPLEQFFEIGDSSGLFEEKNEEDEE